MSSATEWILRRRAAGSSYVDCLALPSNVLDEVGKDVVSTPLSRTRAAWSWLASHGSIAHDSLRAAPLGSRGSVGSMMTMLRLQLLTYTHSSVSELQDGFLRVTTKNYSHQPTLSFSGA